MKKKIIIPIVIIVILSAILCVEVLHFIQKDSSDINKNPPAGTTYINKQETSLEKGIDLSGTYSQNDLEIKEETFRIDSFDEDLQLIQISGLKNKKIEDKINQELKQKTKECANNWLKDKKGHENNVSFNSEVASNFANVLSVKVTFGGDGKEKFIGLNYNLVTGEELKFSDLFNKNESLEAIVRQIFYKSSLHYNHDELDSIEGDPGFMGEPYYDSEKGTWYAEYFLGYDEKSDKAITEIREYVLAMDENEIEKYTKKFLSDENKQFCFSPAKLDIIQNDRIASIYLKDISDCVVIYDKYLTENSIFEKDNIGAKSIITCSFEKNFGKLKETKYESNNLFYDISLFENFDTDFPVNDYAKQKNEEAITMLKERLNEYKETAKNNPDKAYFLFLQTDISNGSYEYRTMDQESGFYRFHTEANSLLIIELKEKVVECKLSEKENVLSQILDCYRYYNLNFWGSIYNYLPDSSGYSTSCEIKDFTFNKKVDYKYYDILRKEEYKKTLDIFIDDVDYLKVLRGQTSNIDIDSNTTYELGTRGIAIEDKSKRTNYVHFEEIKYFIKIKPINPNDSYNEDEGKRLLNAVRYETANETNASSNITNNEVVEKTNTVSESEASDTTIDQIFPSDTRRLEPSEIENMTKDELYLAYNEIFARHGHDFKTKKFKDYFSQKDWYHPIEGKSVELSELNEIEVYNANLLKNAADSK